MKDSESAEKDKKQEKEQKQIEVAYKINCISNIDCVTSTFEIDIKIFIYWKDPKLVGRKKGDKVSFDEDIYNPDIVIVNEHNMKRISNELKMVDGETGLVKQSIEASGTCFLTTMELDLFPFDCHNLRIVLKPYKLPIEEAFLSPYSSDPCSMDYQITQEWNILGFSMTSDITDPKQSSTNKSYSTLSPTVLIVRRSGWFINNVFIVSMLLLFVSWAALAFKPSELSTRLGTCSAMLLANISTKYVVGKAIPKVSFRTLCDLYIDLCFGLQVVETFFILLSFAYRDDVILADLINNFAFTIQIYTFGAYHLWLAWRLKEHGLDIQDWGSQLIFGDSARRPKAKFMSLKKSRRQEEVLFHVIQYSPISPSSRTRCFSRRRPRPSALWPSTTSVSRSGTSRRTPAS